MIIAVSLDPVMHVSYHTKRIVPGTTHHVGPVRYRAGGRGPAVARMLHTFGHEVAAAGLAGGTAGELIRAELARRGVPTQFTRIARESRRLVEVTDAETGTTTRFAEPSPYITTEELGRLAADYRDLLDGASAAVLCGGLPDGLPPETYATFATYAAEAGVPVVLDAGAAALWPAAARHPALVIPEPGGAGPGGADSGVAEAGMHESGGAEPGGADSGVAEAGMHESGGAEPGGADSGVAEAGVHESGVLGAASRGGPDAGVSRGRGGGTGARTGSQAWSEASLRRLLAAGAGAVATMCGDVVEVLTATGQWRARLPGAPPMSRDALVAGLVPGVALGWSWPESLQHAVSLAASAAPAGDPDLVAYEQLLPQVIIESS